MHWYFEGIYEKSVTSNPCLEGTDPTCNAGKDGKIWLKSIQSEVNISYYTWSAANQAAAKDTIFNLAAGSYQLTVTNVSGCKGSTLF